ncbi:MAG: hypothetical protein ACSLFL_01700 [Alphaproteobacteria bacterium]
MMAPAPLRIMTSIQSTKVRRAQPRDQRAGKQNGSRTVAIQGLENIHAVGDTAQERIFTNMYGE